MTYLDQLFTLRKQLSNKKDSFLLEQFQRHGYSKQNLQELMEQDRVCITDLGDHTYYGIDGIYLFMGYTQTDPDSGMVAIKCRDIKEAKTKCEHS